MDNVIVPSYVAKISRAKKHLIELEEVINSYICIKPYAVSTSIESKKKIRRLKFTSDPRNTDIPIVGADVIYSLRSSLDHLMAVMVAKKDRTSAIFPIFFKGVWDAIVPGENSQRTKDRIRWASDIKTLPDDAVTLLKRLQSTNSSGDNSTYNALRVLNRLSNGDRHSKLPVVAAGLRGMIVKWRMPDGSINSGISVPVDELGFFENNAEIPNIPYRAMDVEVVGIPVIAIRLTEEKGFIEIPERLALVIRLIEDEIIPALLPFVRPDAL